MNAVIISGNEENMKRKACGYSPELKLTLFPCKSDKSPANQEHAYEINYKYYTR